MFDLGWGWDCRIARRKVPKEAEIDFFVVHRCDRNSPRHWLPIWVPANLILDKQNPSIAGGEELYMKDWENWNLNKRQKTWDCFSFCYSLSMNNKVSTLTPISWSGQALLAISKEKFNQPFNWSGAPGTVGEYKGTTMTLPWHQVVNKEEI